MKLKNILFIAGILLVGSLTAQISTLEIKGNKHFNDFTFDKAIKKYERLGIKKLTTNGIRNLADAHRYSNNTEKAAEYYAVLSTKTDNKAEDLLMYAKMLEMNKKHTESANWMNKFHKRVMSDSRGIQYASKKEKYTEILKDQKRFKIENLAINTPQEDFGTAFYGEEVVFASSRDTNLTIKRTWNWNKFPFLNIYKAELTEDKKLTKVDRFSKKINKKYHEGTASFSADKNLMVFTSSNYEKKAKNGEHKLKMSFREKTEDNKWGEIKPFDFNNKEYSVGHPALTADGKTLYFISDMPGGKGGTDLYKINRNGDGWTAPINLGDKINTEGNEMFPFYHENGMLFFASNGHVGLGGLDVFLTKVENGKYSEIKNLGYPLNDSKDDFAFILDKDQKYGFFSSNRPGGKGSDDIYSFNLLKPFNICKEIKGLAVDKQGNILPGSEVVLYNNKSEEIEKVIVGDDAAYNFCVKPGNYSINGTKAKYFVGKATANPTENSEPIDVNVVLEKDPGFSMCGIVTNSKTKQTIEGVKVTLIDNVSSNKEELITSNNGEFCKPLQGKKLNDRITYQLLLEKEGFNNKKVKYDNLINKHGKQLVYVELDLELNDKTENLSELITIRPINFDLNKYKIRSDAKIELNKIIAIMNKYPAMIVELGSHTDCRASKKYNKKLSNKRAKASAAYIKTKITNPKRIYGKGYGEEKLLNGCACEGRVKSNCSEEEHEKNRRTEFKVIKTGNDNIKINNNSTDSFDK